MSEENVEIVRRAFDNLHSGDANRAESLATFDPNVVYDPVEPIDRAKTPRTIPVYPPALTGTG